MDETEYLMSSPTMVARLEQARIDIREGKGIKIDLKHLWDDDAAHFQSNSNNDRSNNED